MNRFMLSIGRHSLLAVSVLIAAAGSAAGADFAFITTTDYETGSSSVIYVGSHATSIDVASVHNDAVSRCYGGLVYVVNRLNGDNIQVLDPAAGFATALQFSVGNGSNPKDIAFLAPTKAYVSRYDSNHLLIVNPASGSELGTIDLSSFADGSDGLCEMDQMLIVGERLFVTIQRIDRNNWWLPIGDSYIAVIDVTADTLVDVDETTPGKQSIRLAGSNPYSALQLIRPADRMLVSCVGYWASQDCGIEVINPATCEVEGRMLTEAAAGGDINDFEIWSPTVGYAIVTNSSFNTELIRFNPTTGAKTGTIYSPNAYVINDIELSSDGELYLADQTETAPGIRLFDAATGAQITANPISTGLPPFNICFTTEYVTGTAVPTPVASLGQNFPNPFNPSTTIPFVMHEPGFVTLKVYDAAGRLMRTLVSGAKDAGPHTLSWDGKNDGGGAVASGIYFYRMESAGFSETKKMVLLH